MRGVGVGVGEGRSVLVGLAVGVFVNTGAVVAVEVATGVEVAVADGSLEVFVTSLGVTTLGTGDGLIATGEGFVGVGEISGAFVVGCTFTVGAGLPGPAGLAVGVRVEVATAIVGRVAIAVGRGGAGVATLGGCTGATVELLIGLLG